MSHTEILAHDVPLNEHLACLAKHLGHSGYRTLQGAEDLIYSFAERLAPQTCSFGPWALRELSNGGFYMVPTPGTYVVTTGTGEFAMTADAAGIVVVLYALAHLAAVELPPKQHFTAGYYHLRSFAEFHPDGLAIFDAIDFVLVSFD